MHLVSKVSFWCIEFHHLNFLPNKAIRTESLEYYPVYRRLARSCIFMKLGMACFGHWNNTYCS